MDFRRHSSSKLKLMKTAWRFRPCLLPQLKINFIFSLLLKPSEIVLGQDDLTAPLRITRGPSSEFSCSAALTILKAKGHIPYNGVREAAAAAASDSGRLLRGEHSKFIALVVQEVRDKFRNKTLPKSGEFFAHLELRLDLTNVFVVDRRMVPAADSSIIGLPEKSEADCVSCCCCCFCMEELGGDAASRMPCSHVFHSRCVEKWLRSSHYCPLCRYEMTTD